MATSATTLGIIGVATLVAFGGLVGASMGVIGGGETVASHSNVNFDVDHAISYIAFCGDAENVTIDHTWVDEDGEATAVNYTVQGGTLADLTDIIYQTGGTEGPQEYRIFDPDGMFVSGNGTLLDIDVSNRDPCGDIDADLIIKYDEYDSETDTWNVDQVG